MIREDKKLPEDVQKRIPSVIDRIKAERDVVALYAFGSLVTSRLKPLSDLDFAVLLSDSLDKRERFRKIIELSHILNQTLETDEIDLVTLNDDPVGFAFHILKNGELLYCRDPNSLVDFIEKTEKLYLDFKPMRDYFDRTFLEGIGYSGRTY